MIPERLNPLPIQCFAAYTRVASKLHLYENLLDIQLFV